MPSETKIAEFRAFAERASQLPRLVIQAHDFPDHDAVSSSWALAHLLGHFGVRTVLTYNGLIDRISLKNMIDWLEIDIRHWSDCDLTEDDKIITVDGCIGEKNVMDLPGDEIAVIDHHQVSAPGELWFEDIRPHYGATATIIYEYYTALDIPIPTPVATALHVGLMIDTANLTRGIDDADIQAFACFQKIADKRLIGQICRNSMRQSEMSYFVDLLTNLRVHDKTAFGWLQGGCPKNMLGILGDFLIAIDELDTIILAAQQEQFIQLSLRTENRDINVGRLVKNLLLQQDIGFGGGHWHMAGGIIDRGKYNPPDTGTALHDLFLTGLATDRIKDK